MSGYNSKENLERLIELAFQDSTIKAGMQRANLTKSQLANLYADGESAWKKAAAALDDYNRLHKAVAEAILQRQIVDDLLVRSRQERIWRLILLSSFPVLFATTAWMVNRSTFLPWYVVYLPIEVLIIILFIWNYYRVRRRRMREAKNLSFSGVDIPHDQIVALIVSLTDQIEVMRQTIEQQVSDTIRQGFREYINEHLNPTYSTDFQIVGYAGLGEVPDPSQTINTAALTRLSFLLDHMPGGSIGISGPRGAGKSTLINYFCGPKRVVNTIKEKPILGCMVTAPVHYESRDFLLYLFDAFCDAILDKHQSVINRADYWRQALPKRASIFPRIPRLLPLVFMSIATWLFIGSIYVALTHPASAADDNARSVHIYTTLDSAGVSKIVHAAVSDSDAKAKRAAGGNVLNRLLGLDKADPAWLFWSSIILLCVTAPFLRPRTRLIGRGEEEPISFGENPRGRSLPEQALFWKGSIKFQQSFTVGWSGALKLPIGLEGNVNQNQSISLMPRSTPELVSGFVGLLADCAREYQVIVGIDELDKIDSDEQVQEFINEIKGVFGQPSCFFLVSLSEDAMSQFERRGMPLRDAFDSAFDAVIYANYLNFSQTSVLLDRRVIGRPMPFFALCHCLAGGLAREVIRLFRLLLELRQNGNSSMANLCTALTEHEVRARLRATQVYVKKLQSSWVANQLLACIHAFELASFSSEAIAQTIIEISAMQPVKPDKSEELADHEKALQTSSELVAYLAISLSVIEFFNDRLQRQTMGKLLKSDDIEWLAKARQSIAVDSGLSIAYSEKFRQNYGLRDLPIGKRGSGDPSDSALDFENI